MICTICNLEKQYGDVESGKFICKKCKKEQKTKKEEGVVRYAATYRTYRGGELKIVSARYKETKSYWIKLESDIGWPYEDRIHKTWHKYPPGGDSPQKIFEQIYEHTKNSVDEANRILSQRIEQLAKIEKFGNDNNFSIPQISTKEIEI